MDNLIPIGRFSRITRLSIKALRLYDEMGLLEPAWVDPSSAYRYYAPIQANRAEAIRILRSIDMPLEEIRSALDADDPGLAEKVLSRHRERLARRLADQERMLAFLEGLIQRKENVMPYEVTIKEVQPQDVAALRADVTIRTVGGAIEEGFGTLMQNLGKSQTTPTGAPFIVFHDVIDEETPGVIEMCIPIEAAIDDDERVYHATVAGGPVAATVHRGAYAEIGPAYHTLSGWIQEHGHAISGPPREIYLNDPTQVGEDEQLTEIDWPIAVD
ncbi:MAG: MerR family transcriptional regulator [Acidimicrobiia bacterium]